MEKNNIISFFISVLLITISVSSVTGIIDENKINNIKNDDYSNLINQAVEKKILSTDIWLEKDKLLASDGATGDYFGVSISIDGDTAIIGAHSDENYKGAAYIFIRNGTTWIEEQKLTASDGAANDYFGASVSIDGDTALIGAHSDDNFKGAAYVFIRNGTTWIEEQKLTASDGVQLDSFGQSVFLDGDTALIGALLANNFLGATYVFLRSGTTWIEEQKLTASDGVSGDGFGCFVSLDDSLALIGAPFKDTLKGAAYVFTRSGTTWIEEQKLTASDGAQYDGFGISVSIEGGSVLIGAFGDESFKGAAYVFKGSGTTWIEEQKLTASDGAPNDNFGMNVFINNNTALIGAPGDDNLKGSAYVFKSSDTAWIEQAKLTASDGAAGDYFGGEVFIDSDTAFIGAHGEDNFKGSTYVFMKKFAESNIDCIGDLDWMDVIPGATVYGSINVENVGDPESLLDWEIESFPDWGTWSFNPENGTGLLAGDSIIIDIEVIAPDEPEHTFIGEVVLINCENSSDTCTIDVSLATPLIQVQGYKQIFSRFFESHPNLFPLLHRFLGL